MSSKNYFFFISIFFFGLFISLAQESGMYKIRTIAFYNLENLFDTVNDSLTFDDDRTPTGKDHWTVERYRQKLENMAKVLSEIGSSTTKTSPDIIGVCEVENSTVLEDLLQQDSLRNKDYGIVHFDSPDERGIDVALLYKKNVFVPTSFKSHRLLLYKEDDGFRDFTRDQLVVGGLLDNEQFYFIVNHWPSRSGGEARSKPNRMVAAKLNRRIIDSIKKLNNKAKIMSMGDLNDDPTDDSLKKGLKTIGKQRKIDSTGLFNPMEKMYKKGAGSLAYRDKWNLFDQIFFTGNLIDKSRSTYSYWKAGIYDPSYLKTKKGKYKGYPFRTYAGGNYAGGYSDHFPVYVFLVRKTD